MNFILRRIFSHALIQAYLFFFSLFFIICIIINLKFIIVLHVLAISGNHTYAFCFTSKLGRLEEARNLMEKLYSGKCSKVCKFMDSEKFHGDEVAYE